MGVKSTVTLNRAEAESKFWDLYLELFADQGKVPLNDEQLEDVLESWNDQYHGGEGFENYRINRDYDTRH